MSDIAKRGMMIDRFSFFPALARFAVLLLPALLLQACSSRPPLPAIDGPDGTVQPDHTLFTAVLQDHSHDGLVDYPAIQQDDRFARYLAHLGQIDPHQVRREDRLAFWLNVYNAFTIQRVLEKYPTRSLINKLAYLFRRSAFHVRFIELAGEHFSLNDIEHGIIRPAGEPRIHFALVCAAMSCPPLREEAYLPDKLDSQLDDQARRFLHDPTKNQFDFDAQEVYLSKIFQWFAEDFASDRNGVLVYVSRYFPAGQADLLQAQPESFKIRYLPYDWTLNDLNLHEEINP